jgi:hypothetical protein
VQAGALSRVIGFALHKVQSAFTRWKRAILRRSRSGLPKVLTTLVSNEWFVIAVTA